MVSVRQARGRKYLFLINHTEQDQSVKVPAGRKELITGASTKGNLTLGAYGVAVVKRQASLAIGGPVVNGHGPRSAPAPIAVPRRRGVLLWLRHDGEAANVIRFEAVRSAGQVAAVAALAREIWRECYVPLIGPAQVEYMLARFQSEEAVARQMADGYEYYLVDRDGVAAGYLAVVAGPDDRALMLSKLYVRQSARRQGVGRRMLAFAEDRARQRKAGTLWLTVNKRNRAVAWYLRMGFTNAGALVQDIGAGFVMDDFRMEKPVGEAAPGAPADR